MTTPQLSPPQPATNQHKQGFQLPNTQQAATYTFAQLQAAFPVGTTFTPPGYTDLCTVQSWQPAGIASATHLAYSAFFDATPVGPWFVDTHGYASGTAGDHAQIGDGGGGSITGGKTSPGAVIAGALPALSGIGAQIVAALKSLVSVPFFTRIGEGLLAILILVIGIYLYMKDKT